MVIGEYLNSCGVRTDHDEIVLAMPFIFIFLFLFFWLIFRYNLVEVLSLNLYSMFSVHLCQPITNILQHCCQDNLQCSVG